MSQDSCFPAHEAQKEPPGAWVQLAEVRLGAPYLDNKKRLLTLKSQVRNYFQFQKMMQDTELQISEVNLVLHHWLRVEVIKFKLFPWSRNTINS